MSNVPAIDVEKLRELLATPQAPLILDVREKWENDLCCLPDAKLLPMNELPQRYKELPTDRMIVVHCHHGGRSARATAFLRQNGYDNAYNLTGGIHAWSTRIDPTVKTYQ